MAQATAFKTYDANRNREDLADVIYMISPVDTPFISNVAKVQAKATLHEWSTDALAAAAANAKIEGADFSYTLPTATTRVTNNTQILQKTFEVSATQEAVDKAGVQSEFARQLGKATKELANDVEYAMFNGTGNSGASGTARALKGIMSFLATNVETGSGTGTQALTETMLNDLLQTIYVSGGNPDWILCGPKQKRVISSFATNVTRNVNASAKEQVNVIEVYESDFGRLSIDISRYIASDQVAVLQKDMWAVAELRPTQQVEPAKTSDGEKGVVLTELTLQARNEASSGKITQLTTA
jgi:hypothetical protein